MSLPMPPNPPGAGPLAGLRAIELEAIGPVPMAATLLADLGAEVLRIDRPGTSGLGIAIPPEHDVHLRSRRRIALDLVRPAGREVLHRLLADADVLLEGLRPGVLERLGLGPEALLERHPRLVIGRMTGWGQTGPLASSAGHDLNYLALSGALHAFGRADGAPVPPLNLVADYGGGALYLAFGTMAALWERQRSGRGQVVDAAMLDGTASLMGLARSMANAGLWNPAERGDHLLGGSAPWYACHRAACGGWLAVAALEPKFFASFLRVAGLADSWLPLQHDRRAWPAMHAAIATRLGGRTRAEWLAAFDGVDACVSPVLDLDEAAAHPHAVARSTWVDVPTPAGTTRQPGSAPRFDRSTPPRPVCGRGAGADGEAVLREAGFDDAQIAALRQSGAWQPPVATNPSTSTRAHDA
jgi:alpha-methylacyl-CoA racemase